jgi:rhodanese-related sulfurtransferase
MRAPHDMYTGAFIRHVIMGGDIPGAVNRISLDSVDEQTGEWRDDERLPALYGAITKDKRIFVYCHDAFRMGLTYLQLKHPGYADMRLYNGGWSHWGNERTLPIVTGPDPYGGNLARSSALPSRPDRAALRVGRDIGPAGRKGGEKVQARDRTDQSRTREGFALGLEPDVSVTDEGVVPVDTGPNADRARDCRGDPADGPVRATEAALANRKSGGTTGERNANDQGHAPPARSSIRRS